MVEGGDRMSRERKCKPLLQVLLLFFMTTAVLLPEAHVRSYPSILPAAVASLDQTAIPQRRTLKAVTYNMRHAQGMDGSVDLRRVIDLLKELGADVIALQEVDRYLPRSGMKDQIDEIARQLDMSWSFAPTIRLGWMEYGNAILSKYPIQHIDHLMLPGRAEMRGVLETTIDFYETPVHIYNSHLSLQQDQRKEQLQQLMEWIEPSENVAVLMGDFNMGRAHPWMAPLYDQWTLLTNDEATLQNGRQVDHIFVNRQVDLLQLKVIRGEASDHFPVLAEWVWSP